MRSAAGRLWQNRRVVQPLARIVLALALLALLAAPWAGPGGSAVFVVASLLVPGALLVSSVPLRGGAGGRVACALVLTLLLEGGAMALLLGVGRPAAAWIMLGVLGLAPLLVVPALHAVRGRSDGTDPE